MNIYYVRQFWFDDFVETDGNWQRAYITWTDFKQQNIKVTAQVNIVSPGAYIQVSGSVTGDLGTAAVGIKWYEYIDSNGNLQHIDNTYFVPHATIRNCVALQLELAYRRVWAGATGNIFYFTD